MVAAAVSQDVQEDGSKFDWWVESNRLSVVVGDVDGEENLELVRTEAAGTWHVTACEKRGPISDTGKMFLHLPALFRWHETHWHFSLTQTQRIQRAFPPL